VPRQPNDKRDPKSIPKRALVLSGRVVSKYGNLVPRDIATRAIHKVVYELKSGIDGQPMVYLDLTHIDRATLDRNWKASWRFTRSLSATTRAILR